MATLGFSAGTSTTDFLARGARLAAGFSAAGATVLATSGLASAFTLGVRGFLAGLAAGDSLGAAASATSFFVARGARVFGVVGLAASALASLVLVLTRAADALRVLGAGFSAAGFVSSFSMLMTLCVMFGV